jgi:hypothetical protein
MKIPMLLNFNEISANVTLQFLKESPKHITEIFEALKVTPNDTFNGQLIYSV